MIIYFFSEAGEAQTVVKSLQAKNWSKRQENTSLTLVHVLCTRYLDSGVSRDAHLQKKGLWTTGSSMVIMHGTSVVRQTQVAEGKPAENS